MRRIIPILCILGVTGAIAAFFAVQGGERGAVSDLAQRTRDGLIRVEGGRFMAGNYKAPFQNEAGEITTRWVYEPGFVLPPHEIELSAYYLQDREASYADFNLFLRARGKQELTPDLNYRVGLLDHAAILSWQEADEYCRWLGEVSDLPLRLPTEAEWEFAARSGNFVPPWATNDGSYREGENVPLRDRDQPDLQDPPIASLPPNPLGFHDMAAGLYEWVSNPTGSDTGSVRVFKGGSNFSTILREVIPTRGLAEAATPDLIALLPEAMAARIQTRDDAPIHLADATARCAMGAKGAPDTIGRAPTAPVNLNGPFVSLERKAAD